MPNPRKPVDSKRLQGTDRADREPKGNAEPVLLSPPKWLPHSARPVWDEIAPLLFAYGLSTDLDVHVLARYSTAEAKRREAESAGHSGVAVRYTKLAEMLGGKLGLNPTDRQRLPVRKDTPNPNGVERLLDGPGRFFTS